MDEGAAVPARSVKARVLVLLAIAVIFAGVLIAKAFAPPGVGAGGGGTAGEPVSPGDAAAAYEHALDAGRPIYILFHSETCVPCVEIDKVADAVIPEYEGRITFVDAVTDSPGSRELATRFPFQYIPTSFFLGREGDIVDSHTGVLTEDEMRARLDALLE